MSSSYIVDCRMMLRPSDINLGDSHVMAIINLTPDSFYGASRHLSADDACDAVERVVREGATIVDLGGYSSRSGAADVPLEEEWRRVHVGLDAVRKVECGVVVSIDTFRAEVVQRAYDEFGEFIVNDISAGEADDRMVATVARLQLPYVAMHMRGTPAIMNNCTNYNNITADVIYELSKRINRLTLAGVNDIIIDPGFGVAKTLEQNYELLHNLEHLHELGYPLLVGVSRKSMIYNLLNTDPNNALNGTTVLNTYALMNGAKFIRVHDVKEAVETIKIIETINK